MTQLEIYTDAGIVGRSLAGGNDEIVTGQLLPRIVGMAVDTHGNLYVATRGVRSMQT
jgi:hypothetical protein